MSLYVLTIHTHGEGTNNDEYFRDPGINVFDSKEALKKAIILLFKEKGISTKIIPEFIKYGYFPFKQDHFRITETSLNPKKLEGEMLEIKDKYLLDKRYSEEKAKKASIRVSFDVDCKELGLDKAYFNKYIFSRKDPLSESKLNEYRVLVGNNIKKFFNYTKDEYKVEYRNADIHELWFTVKKNSDCNITYRELQDTFNKAIPEPIKLLCKLQEHEFTFNLKKLEFYL